MVIVALLCAGMIAGFVWSLLPEHQLFPNPQLGHRNDTIQLAVVKRLFHSAVSVSTCDQAGDSQHINLVYLVQRDNISIHETTETYQSTRLDQYFPSATTGLIDYLYLLKGSQINYTLCIGSVSSKTLSGSLFIFNSDSKYSQYEESPEQGEALSIFSVHLKISNDNATNCLSIKFEAPESSYYFLTSRTPGEIFYTYNYTKHVYFYAHNDYQEICSVYEGEHCGINIPGSLFTSQEYVLLAYVEPNVVMSAKQNHICVSSSRSESSNLILGISASLGGLAFLIILMVVTANLFICLKHKRTRGYESIQGSPPSYNVRYTYK